ncbi:hypothetical protein KW784_00695 [Candidatus Parcubacteria bacterium]|nr:hypothetical protein [Candidatus Parcubacteria bacterium]
MGEDYEGLIGRGGNLHNEDLPEDPKKLNDFHERIWQWFSQCAQADLSTVPERRKLILVFLERELWKKEGRIVRKLKVLQEEE